MTSWLRKDSCPQTLVSHWVDGLDTYLSDLVEITGVSLRAGAAVIAVELNVMHSRVSDGVSSNYLSTTLLGILDVFPFVNQRRRPLNLK